MTYELFNYWLFLHAKCNESAFIGKVQMQTSALILSVKNQCTDYVDDLSDIFVLFVNSFILHVACMIIVVKS